MEKIERIHYFRQNLKGEHGRTIAILFKHAASFYNTCLYKQQQNFKNGKKYITWVEMRELLKKDSNFILLGESISVSIIRNLDINYKNFFTNNRKTGNLESPKFRYGKGFFISFFGNRITKDGFVNIPLSSKFKEKYNIDNFKIKISKKFLEKEKEINQLRIHDDYVVFHYKEESLKIKGDGKLGIDLGVDNMISVFSTTGNPFIINGRPLKFLNYKFLTYEKISSEKRKNKIDNYFKRAIKFIYKYCLKNKIGTIICGFFKDIKLKHKNRNFFYIPFLKLRLGLRDMCNKYGINIEFVEESYTSKCCFLLNEDIKNKETYYGYRKERGLHKIKGVNISYNCDINGAGNILRKRYEVDSEIRKKCLLNPIKIGGIIR